MKTGKLKEGQDIIAGETYGRVRRLEDFKGMRITEAYPSTPLSLIGLHAAPNTNDIVQVISPRFLKEKLAKTKGFKIGEQGEILTAQKIYKSIGDESVKKLNIVLKSDVQGSLEAIEQILGEIKSEKVAIFYISAGVGNVTESDVRLLQTLVNNLSIALENARLFMETQRLLRDTEERAAELSVINSIRCPKAWPSALLAVSRRLLPRAAAPSDKS